VSYVFSELKAEVEDKYRQFERRIDPLQVQFGAHRCYLPSGLLTAKDQALVQRVGVRSPYLAGSNKLLLQSAILALKAQKLAGGKDIAKNRQCCETRFWT
jgi:hypothetical protein